MKFYHLGVILIAAVWLSCSDSPTPPDDTDAKTSEDSTSDVSTEDSTEPGEDVTDPQEDVTDPQEDVTETGDETTDPEEVEEPDPGVPCVDDFCAAGPDSAPDPSKPGPFPVGIKTAIYTDYEHPNVDDETPRILKTEIWYPTTEEFRNADRYAYDPKADGTDDLREKYADIDLGIFPCDGVYDAPVLRNHGKFPLLIFSHGAFGIRYQSVYHTIHMASHGYIVAAPDHQYNTLYEIMVKGWSGPEIPYSAMARPTDIQFLINVFTERNADPDDELYNLIDLDNIAVTGHSFGGLTAYLALFDKRVKAIVPMAPEGTMIDLLSSAFSGPKVYEIDTPTLMMGGRLDRTLRYKESMADIFEQQGPPKWFLTVNRGGHYTFTDMCRMNLEELQERWVDAKDALKDGCDPENNWDYREAQKAINLYIAAFLNTFIRHSPGSAQWLTPEAGAEFGDEIEFVAVPE